MGDVAHHRRQSAKRWVIQCGDDDSPIFFVMDVTEVRYDPETRVKTIVYQTTLDLARATAFRSEWAATAMKGEWCLSDKWRAREYNLLT